jgi:hypothetical protein
MRLHGGDLVGELIGQPQIVGVDKCRILASRFLQTQIPRTCRAFVCPPWVLEIVNLRVAGHVVRRQLGRAIRGAVIDNQQFPSWVSLLQDAFDSFSKERQRRIV